MHVQVQLGHDLAHQMRVKRNSNLTPNPTSELRRKGGLGLVTAFASWKEPLARLDADQRSIDFDVAAQQVRSILREDMLSRLTILGLITKYTEQSRVGPVQGNPKEMPVDTQRDQILDTE